MKAKRLKHIPIWLFLIGPIITICLLPFFNYVGEFWFRNVLRIICILIMIIMYVHEIYSKDFRITLPFGLFCLFLTWVFISECVEGFTSGAVLWDSYNNGTLIDYYLYVGCFFAFSMKMSNKEYVFNIQMIVSVILATGSLYTYLRYGIPYGTGLSSIFNQFNHYGYYLAVSCILPAMLIIYSKSSYIPVIAFGINSVVLILNDTFGAWLAVFIGLIFGIITYRVVYQKWSKKSFVILGLFLLISICVGYLDGRFFSSLMQFSLDTGKIKDLSNDITAADRIGSTRGIIWRYTIQYITEKPLFGWGIEGTQSMLMNATGSSRPHNEYLTYAVYFGIPALVLYLSAVMSVFFHNLKHKKQLSTTEIISMVTAFTYLVSACFGNIKSYTAPLLFIFLGMAYHSEKSVVSKTIT